MLWLPASDVASGRGPIAVADASALALECAVLEPDAAARHLLGAMLVDPWFSRWVAGCDEQACSTLAALAERFADELMARLASLQICTNAWTRPVDHAASAYADQAAGLQHAGLNLLAYGEQAADSVAFYRATIDAADVPSGQAASAVYLQIAPGIEWRLPRLVARLSQFQQLATDFDAQLELAKLDSMKELAYGASHEVNNPLANISGRAQALLRDETDPRRRRLLQAMDSQALRAHEMISDLMLFARPPALEKEPTDLLALVDVVVGEMRDRGAERHIEIAVDRSNGACVATIDPTQTAVAVGALVRNAMEAIGNDGQVTVAVARESNSALVRVADTGPGIADDVRRHMFDPFYSGREAGRGLGFGLSKCWRIAREHGGSVEVEQTSATGTTIVLKLPRGPVDAASPGEAT